MKHFLFLFSTCLLLNALTVHAQLPLPSHSLLIDLNADLGVTVEAGDSVARWANQAAVPGLEFFNKRDSGRKVAGSGRPLLKKRLAEIRGHQSVSFDKQELCTEDEEATDSLILGTGFTWIAILKPYRQAGELKEVNTFFGNLKNGGNFEGVWGNLADDNRVWTGGRNGITFGRWDSNNPFIATTQKLDSNRFYLLAGRMAAGTDTVLTEIFINDLSRQAASGLFPVNIHANSSRMAIGEERDATNHPGVEAFRGEIARFLLYKRPLSDEELKKAGKVLTDTYGIRP